MKHILIYIALMLCMGTAFGQSSYTKVDSTTFQAAKTVRAKASSYQPTGNYYVAKDGKQYEIYLHTCKKGKHKGETFCYILKTSAKTGKTYWQKLELGVDESLIFTETIDVKPEELSK